MSMVLCVSVLATCQVGDLSVEPLLPVSNFSGHGVTRQGLKIILHKSCGFSVAGVLSNVHV